MLDIYDDALRELSVNNGLAVGPAASENVNSSSSNRR